MSLANGDSSLKFKSISLLVMSFLSVKKKWKRGVKECKLNPNFIKQNLTSQSINWQVKHMRDNNQANIKQIE